MAELARWSVPAEADISLRSHEWLLYPDLLAWIPETVKRYHFEDAGELMRHLIFIANQEPKPRKKLIFKVIRCKCDANRHYACMPRYPPLRAPP